MWIGVEDVKSLYQEYTEHGASILHSPTNYPWAYEMKVQDPDGHVLLRIGTAGGHTFRFIACHAGGGWVSNVGGGVLSDGERVIDPPEPALHRDHSPFGDQAGPIDRQAFGMAVQLLDGRAVLARYQRRRPGRFRSAKILADSSTRCLQS